jgi:Second Messenger Oligonucleotide or Dinucleotide Synthetase domain
MREYPQLDELLDLACEELQLPFTHHVLAERHYHAVAAWLDAEDSPLRQWRPTIYPQGSFLIGTTTRPIHKQEYDLDFVCQMQLDHSRNNAVTVLDRVKERLLSNGTYAPMVEAMKRCVRLNYAGNFHMDILPGAPDQPGFGTRIRVPDRRLAGWKSSDPKGFATWFHRRGTQLLEKRADAEPIPRQQSVAEKTALQRAVQLAKRARDRYFDNNTDLAPRSIVLTTLMGHAYRGQRSTSQTVHDMLVSLRLISGATSAPIVLNPANPEEMLSEQWATKPETFAKFGRWLDWFAAGWGRVLAARSVQETQKELSGLFGGEVVQQAFVKQAQRLDELRKAGRLGIDRTGSLVVDAGLMVRTNTFFGS